MPTKTWVVGEEVLAADFNTFVQKQVVATFPNAAARDAAIPAPSEGMICYLADTDFLSSFRNGLWRPPVGTVLSTSALAIPNINTAAGGTYDLVSIDQGRSYPFDTLTFAHFMLTAGFGGGEVRFNSDIYSFGLNGVTIAIPSPVSAPAAALAAAPLMTVWGNAPSTSVGWKARLNYLSGSNIHTSGSVVTQVIVHL